MTTLTLEHTGVGMFEGDRPVCHLKMGFASDFQRLFVAIAARVSIQFVCPSDHLKSTRWIAPLNRRQQLLIESLCMRKLTSFHSRTSLRKLVDKAVMTVMLTCRQRQKDKKEQYRLEFSHHFPLMASICYETVKRCVWEHGTADNSSVAGEECGSP